MSTMAKVVISLIALFGLGFVVSISGFIYSEFELEEEQTKGFAISVAVSLVGLGILAVLFLLRWVWRVM